MPQASPLMTTSIQNQQMLSTLPQLPISQQEYLQNEVQISSENQQLLPDAGQPGMYTGSRRDQGSSFGNQLRPVGSFNTALNVLNNSERSLTQLNPSGQEMGAQQVSNSHKLSNVDGNTLNDYELESQDPFIDFLSKTPPGYGVHNMMEGQRTFNNYNHQMPNPIQMDALNQNTYAIGGNSFNPNNFAEPSMGQEGPLQNLNQTYLGGQPNPGQLEGQHIGNAQMQQYVGAQQHQFNHPLGKTSPQIKKVVRTSFQGDNLHKTKSMANVYANPEVGVNINAISTTNQNIKGTRARIPKSQSDNNLILLSNNLSKNNIQRSQFDVGGRGTRRKVKQQNKQGALQVGNQMSASKSNKAGYKPQDQEMSGTASSGKKSGPGSKGLRGKAMYKTESHGNLLSLQQKQSDAMASSCRQSSPQHSNYSTGQAFQRQLQKEQNARRRTASRKDQQSTGSKKATPHQQKHGILRNATTSQFNTQPTKLRETSQSPAPGQQMQVEFNVPATTRAQINEEHRNEKKKRGGRRSQSDSATRQEQRLAKNRISAANSRRRKKAYIEELEESKAEAESKFHEQEKEINRLRTINNNLKKQLAFQEPLTARSSKEQFFKERIQDFLKLEENLLEPAEAQLEMKEIIDRLNGQTGAYGIRRKELVDNLFKSIIELSVPGFVEYLFWLIETKGEYFADTFDEVTVNSPSESNKAASKLPKEPEAFGYDEQTGYHFMKERRRKPTRYFVNDEGTDEGLGIGAKFNESTHRTLNWMELTPDQSNLLRGQKTHIQAHYKRFRSLIDNLMETKEKLLLEMKAMDQTTEHLKQFLVPQQVAKFLLLSDKSKTTQEFDIFRLWEIKRNSHREHQMMEETHTDPQYADQNINQENEQHPSSSHELDETYNSQSRGLHHDSATPNLAGNRQENQMMVDDQENAGLNPMAMGSAAPLQNKETGRATMGNNNEQKQQNFQQQNNQQQQNAQGHIQTDQGLIYDRGLQGSANQAGLGSASDQQLQPMPELSQILESPNPPKHRQQDNFLNGF